MAQIAASADPILTPLHAVIQRRRLRTVLRIALVCLLAALTAFVAALLLDRFGLSSISPALAIAAIAIPSALVASLIAWSKRRTPLQEAFFIDQESNFRQAYGTAVELSATGTAASPVPAELMGAVRQTAAAIAPHRLIRFFTPLSICGIATAILLACAALWLNQLPPPPPPAAIQTAEPAPPASTETLAAIAEMLAGDAQARDDALLGAIARSLAERAETAGAEGLTENLTREINDLLDQAASAYGDRPPQWLGGTEGMRLSELEAALETASQAPAPASPTAPLDAAPRSASDIQATPQGPGMYEARPELAERYADRGADETMASNAVITEGEAPTDLGGASGESPQLMEPQQLQSIGSIPVGAALQSGRGLSNAAGLGEEDLQSDDAFAGLAAQPAEDMVISAEPQAGGSRIRIDIVPQAAEGGTGGAASAIGGQTGSGSSEPVARDFIPATARDISARYFERTPQ